MKSSHAKDFMKELIRKYYLPGSESPPSLPGNSSSTNKVIVLDKSQSMAERDYPPCRLAVAQDAAVELVAEVLRSNPNGRIGVIGFCDVGLPVYQLTQPLVKDKIERAIRSLSPGGNTNIAWGLFAAKCMFSAAQCPLLCKEIVLLSDGFHGSDTDPRVIANQLKNAGCVIHTIGIGGEPEAVDEQLLRDVASIDGSGNPRYRFFSDRNGLVRHFGNLGGLTR